MSRRIDSSRLPSTSRIRLAMVTIGALLFLIFSSSPHLCKAETAPQVQPYEAALEYKKLIMITLTKMPDGVTGMKSTAYINAPPVTVWKVLTDYNNLKRYIPRMVESDLVGSKGNLKVIDLTGEFRVLLYKKTIRVTVNMLEKYPSRIDYEQISGDFEVYRGSWILQMYSSEGTILTYESEIKPSFAAPDFIFQGILKNDMAAGLTALKAESERLQANQLVHADGLQK